LTSTASFFIRIGFPSIHQLQYHTYPVNRIKHVVRISICNAEGRTPEVCYALNPELPMRTNIPSLIRDSEMVTYIHMDRGTKWHAHVSLLCQYSPFFKKALTGPFQESRSKSVEIHDVKLWVYFKVLQRTTSGHIGDDTEHDGLIELQLVHVVCFADKYSVPELLMEVTQEQQ